MHDTVAVRGNDLRKYLGTNAKLAVPDVHGDVLDPGGKADTGIVEHDVQPSVRCHHRVHHLRPVLFRCHVEAQVGNARRGPRRAGLPPRARPGRRGCRSAPPSRPRARTDAMPRRRSPSTRPRSQPPRRSAAPPCPAVASSPPASQLIGGRMHYFACCIHRRAAVRVAAALAVRAWL